MVLTTTSTWEVCNAVMRSAADKIRYSTCDGLPKMSRATSPAMSTSNPVMSPVIGSRKLNRLLPMSSPTINRPRSWILATAASASALVRNGRKLAVGLQSWLAASGGSGGSGGITSIPTGVGYGSVGVVSTFSDSEWPQPASRTAAARSATGDAALEKLGRPFITDILSAWATVRVRRRRLRPH